MKLFSVVEFPEEYTVETILSSWLNNERNSCRYPKVVGPGGLTKLLRDSVLPQPNWLTFPCRVLGSYGTITDARAAANKAQFSSLIESDFTPIRSTHGRPKRKKKQKTTSPYKKPRQQCKSSDDDIVGFDIQYSVYKATNSNPFLTPPRALSINSSVGSANIDTGSSHALPNETVRISSVLEETRSHQPPPNVVQDLVEPQSPGGQEYISIDASQLENVVQIEGSDLQLLSETTGLATKKDIKDLKEVLLRKLLKINDNQKDILNLLAQTKGSNQASNLTDFSRLPKFPLESMQQIHELESFCDDAEDRKTLTSYLALIGGSSLEEVVRGILRRIFGREFACKFSFTGKGNNKLAFSSFKNLHHTLIDTVRRHGKHTGATEICIKEITKDFFRFAPSQNMEREKRRTN